MQRSARQISICPNCGGVLEEIFGGELDCMSYLLRAGIGGEGEAAEDSAPKTFKGGARFGIYKIYCHADGNPYKLGRGSIGITYRATDTSLQRKAALKILKTDIAERGAGARERLVRKTHAASALRHAHIATIHQFEMRLKTGQYFYAMEVIDGETIEERVHRAGLLHFRVTIDKSTDMRSREVIDLTNFVLAI